MRARRLAWVVCICAGAALLAGCAGGAAKQAGSEGRLPTGRLSRELLDQSLALGRGYMLAHQRQGGNFDYEYDFVAQRLTPDDNAVRQAGALWGLALMHRENPAPETLRGVRRGLAFFAACSRTTDKGLKYIAYPGESKGATGCAALVALALIELLRAEQGLPDRAVYERDLEGYVGFLLSLRMADGRFHGAYDLRTGRGFGAPSSYFDGEALLALVKAVKYAGYPQLKSLVLESAEAMYRRNILDALAAHPDSAVTKGFYQWSSLAYYEIYTSGWPEGAPYAARVIELGRWMVDTHRVLTRTRNTAYAFEGLATAWELARLTGDHAAQEKFAAVIDRGLYRLTTWQVGSPAANGFLRMAPANARGRGGVMNSEFDSRIRIDAVQHQMHAVMLVRRFLYGINDEVNHEERNSNRD